MSAEQNPILSLVVPTINERENIAELVRQVHAALPLIAHEIIIVDDASDDGTPQLVQRLAAADPAVRLLCRERGLGLSSAVIDGFKSARGQFLGVMDADLSHDAAILPDLVRGVEQGAQMAIGSRRVPGGGADKWPWHRRLFSSAATWAAKSWLGTILSDPMSGFFVVRREVFEEVAPRLNPKGYKILLEIATRAGVFSVREVPFIFKDRKQGHSKLSGRVARQYLEMLWDLRDYAGCSRLLRRLYYNGLYVKIKAALGPGSVLDLACGRPCEAFPEQALLIYLNRPGLVGCDFYEAAGPYRAVRAELRDLPFDTASFDNVVGVSAFASVRDIDGALAEVARVLRPGGLFVFSEQERGFCWRLLRPLWTACSGKTRNDGGELCRRAADWLALIDSNFTVRAVRRHWLGGLVFVCVRKA